MVLDIPKMQDLYDSLIEMGSSIEGAICAGVMIEKLDICDITEFSRIQRSLIY